MLKIENFCKTEPHVKVGKIILPLPNPNARISDVGFLSLIPTEIMFDQMCLRAANIFNLKGDKTF
jgi:hypothetical protein